MENLRSKIERALKEAMLVKDDVAKDALRGLLTAVKNKEKELKRLPTDNEIMQIISSQIKQRKESIEQFKAGGREELASKEAKEIEILEKFLPAQLSKEELEKIIDEAIKEANATSPKDMGKVMKIVMPKVAGRADGKVVNEMVKAKLSS